MLLHAVSPCAPGGIVSWPPLLEGICIDAVRDLQVTSCFARVLQGPDAASIVQSDPAVIPGGTVCLVAMGGCEQWCRGVRVRSLGAGDHCAFDEECDCVALPPAGGEQSHPAGILLLTLKSLAAARAASGLVPQDGAKL